jgi:shikimate kinase
MDQRGDSPIFLIGYRGTGKTSVARELAARLKYSHIDADDAVEHLVGKTIASIFADEGEVAFRDWESRVIVTLGRERRAVVALGGGAVQREENRRVICEAGPVVWLTASADAILERLAGDPATASRRPDLTAVGGRAEIEALIAERTPLYRQCATLVVDTEGRTPADVAEEIAANL